MAGKVRAYKSGDYAGLECGPLEFYFGYETTVCSKHGAKEEEFCKSIDCDYSEWAFTAKWKDVEMMRLAQSELGGEESEDPAYYLLLGIGHYLRGKRK